MKMFRYLLLLLLLAPFVYAETTVIDQNFNNTDTFKINNVDYKMDYSFKSEKVLIKSIYSKLILGKYACEDKGYYEFCFVNISEETEREDTKIKLAVYGKNCSLYNVNRTQACRHKVGEGCESDYSCMSGKCLHNICTFIYPICGDGYCDGNERCTADCKEPEVNETANETQENETAVNETIAEPAEEEPVVEEPEPEEVEEPEANETSSELAAESPINIKRLVIWISVYAIIAVVVGIIAFEVYKKKHSNDEIKLE